MAAQSLIRSNLTRRQLVRLGGIGMFGLGLPDLLRRHARSQLLADPIVHLHRAVRRVQPHR